MQRRLVRAWRRWSVIRRAVIRRAVIRRAVIRRAVIRPARIVCGRQGMAQRRLAVPLPHLTAGGGGPPGRGGRGGRRGGAPAGP